MWHVHKQIRHTAQKHMAHYSWFTHRQSHMAWLMYCKFSMFFWSLIYTHSNKHWNAVCGEIWSYRTVSKDECSEFCTYTHIHTCTLGLLPSSVKRNTAGMSKLRMIRNMMANTASAVWPGSWKHTTSPSKNQRCVWREREVNMGNRMQKYCTYSIYSSPPTLCPPHLSH